MGRLLLALGLIAAAGTACSKSWVLNPDLGAGGMGGMTGSTGGAGGAPVADGSGGLPGFAGHGDFGSGGHASCKSMGVGSSTTTAEMVFVVGRNASMANSFGDSGSRMTAVQTAVHNAVFAEQNFVNFGYQSFPSFNGCPDGSMCCSSADDGTDTQPVSTPSIDKVLYRPCDQNQSGGGSGCVAFTDSRAVSSTLNSIMGRFDSNPDPSNDRYVVLVTDGPPGCPSDDPYKACTAAQTAVSKLANANIKTFVVDVGANSSGDACLDQLATAGGAHMPTFYPSDPSSLASALAQITNVAAVTTCTIVLSGGVDPDQLQVFVGTRQVHFEAAGVNGWNVLPGPPSISRIQLHGSACAYALALHEPSVQVFSGCPPCTAASSSCL